MVVFGVDMEARDWIFLMGWSRLPFMIDIFEIRWGLPDGERRVSRVEGQPNCAAGCNEYGSASFREWIEDSHSLKFDE